MKNINLSNKSILKQQLIILGTPLVLGILEIFHPIGLANRTPFESIAPKVNWWITLHLLQLPLFGLLGLAVILLVNHLKGLPATISRMGIAFFLIFYTALDSIMGIAGGVLIRGAKDLSSNVQIFAAKQFNILLFDPIIGGSTFSLISILGGGGWLIGVIGAAIALKRSGAPYFSIVLLITSGFLFGLAHVPPTGPLGMACFFIAVAFINPTIWSGDKNF